MRLTKRLEQGGGMQHFQDALAEIIAQKIEFPRGSLVTVVSAKLTRDTRHAKCVISVMPISFEKDVLDVLIKNSHEIKDELGSRLRLRRIPNLHWCFDHTEDQAQDIESIILDLKNRGEI